MPWRDRQGPSCENLHLQTAVSSDGIADFQRIDMSKCPYTSVSSIDYSSQSATMSY